MTTPDMIPAPLTFFFLFFLLSFFSHLVLGSRLQPEVRIGKVHRTPFSVSEPPFSLPRGAFSFFPLFPLRLAPRVRLKAHILVSAISPLRPKLSGLIERDGPSVVLFPPLATCSRGRIAAAI